MEGIAILEVGPATKVALLRTLLGTLPPVYARFYPNPGDPFHVTPDQEPVFTQYFPNIMFNPPAGAIPGYDPSMAKGPFTDVTTDVGGSYTGQIVAQGNGFQAHAGALGGFGVVFTGKLYVAAAGDVHFWMMENDGFILGIANGATPVSGPMINPPCRSPQWNPERFRGSWCHVGCAGFEDDVATWPGARGARGVFGRAEGCMKSARRHHGLHIGCSPRPTCGSVAFSSGRSLPHVSMVKTAEA